MQYQLSSENQIRRNSIAPDLRKRFVTITKGNVLSPALDSSGRVSVPVVSSFNLVISSRQEDKITEKYSEEKQLRLTHIR